MTDDPDDLAWQLESRLTSHGVYVTDFERDEDGFVVEYESIGADSVEGVPHREMGRLVNVFRDVLGEDWSAGRIDVTVLDLEGETQGYWHVEREWLAALSAGDLSEVEFSDLVVDSIESPPD